MLFGDESLFSLVRAAKLGQVELPPVLARLRDWIHDEFDVHVVHIVFEHVEIGPCTGRPRLNIVLETDADFDSWKTDAVTIRPDVERRVLSQFTKLAETDPSTYDTDGVFLILDNFSGECLGRACAAFRENDAGRIINEFSQGFFSGTKVPIWKIDGFSRYIVVFMTTEKDIRVNSKNGTCTKICDRIFADVQKYDEFGYLTHRSFRLKFDSKENLDKNYQGSLFYYWR